jgi:hypothetical protein
MILGALVLIVITVGSVAAYILQGQNQENRPAAGLCCNGGTCADGTPYGGDGDVPHDSCGARASDFCGDKGGPGSGGGQCSGGDDGGDDDDDDDGGSSGGACDGSSQTASACRNKPPGGIYPYSGGHCKCVQTTGSLCACVDTDETDGGDDDNECSGTETRKGACGTDGCGPNLRPVYICTSGGTFSSTRLNCASDSICTTSGGGGDDDGGTGGAGDNGGGTGASCTSTAGANCESTGCCQNGMVCQGVAGSRRCEVPAEHPNDQCQGGACTQWRGHHCTSLDSNGTCNDNGQNFSSYDDAREYSGSCGQVDRVCDNNSTNAGALCGDFTIFNQCGGGGGGDDDDDDDDDEPETPVYECNDICTSNSQCIASNPDLRCLETATGNKKCRLPAAPGSNTCQPPVGPQCLAVRLRTGDGKTGIQFGAGNDPKIGDSITLFCPKVEGVDHYRFRIVEPGGKRKPLAVGTVSAQISVPYTITKSGKFFAQCQICTGAADTTCHPYENLE